MSQQKHKTSTKRKITFFSINTHTHSKGKLGSIKRNWRDEKQRSKQVIFVKILKLNLLTVKHRDEKSSILKYKEKTVSKENSNVYLLKPKLPIDLPR